MITARITGADQLRKAARDLRRMDRTVITREVRGALKSTVDERLPPLLRASAIAHLPSGYRKIMAAAVKVKTSAKVGTSNPRVTVTVFAPGFGREHRDVVTIDGGRLRHPVFGRTRRTALAPEPSPWSVTTVRPGFAERPIQALRAPLVAAVDAQLSKVATRFNAGGDGS